MSNAAIGCLCFILKTIRFENIELNSGTFEGTRTDKSYSRTFEGFENMCEPWLSPFHSEKLVSPDINPLCKRFVSD